MDPAEPYTLQNNNMEQSSPTLIFAPVSVPPLTSYLATLRTTSAPQISISVPELRLNVPKFSTYPASLGEKLIGDILVATSVTFLAAPWLTVVDKALVQRAANSHTLIGSAKITLLSMAHAPMQYLKSPTMLWMWATYAATYSAANSLRTYTEHRDYVQVKSQPQRQYKSNSAATLLVGTTLVNTSASLAKDRAYARLFGTASNVAVPKISYALWMARDVSVISSSFVLPTYVAKHLESSCGWQSDTASKVAQLGTPVMAQLIAGPLHYVGLDCHNRNLSHNCWMRQLAHRAEFIKAAYMEVVLARMIRIIPGYGIAGVLNTSCRQAYRNALIQRQMNHHSTPQSVAKLVALIRSKTMD